MHRVTKLAAILGLGLAVELATIAQALAQSAMPAAPLPGPYQVIIAPLRANQMQIQQRPQTMRPNWARNAAQALPYWMQRNPVMNAITPNTQPVPQQRMQQGNMQVGQTSQTGQASQGMRAGIGGSTSGGGTSNMRATPGYFPGYVSAPTPANRTQNPRPQQNNQPQYRPQNAPFGQGFMPGNMQQNRPYYGQMMPPQMMQQPWGGYNNPAYGPAYGQNFGPPNGYGNPPRNGAYAQPPRR